MRGAAPMRSNHRPLPRVGDNLDRLLDLLDQARLEQEARLASDAHPKAAYVSLLAVVEGRQRVAIPA